MRNYRMEQRKPKPFIWLNFASDKSGYNTNKDFNAWTFLKTNHDFNVVFVDDVKNASFDLLLKISGI